MMYLRCIENILINIGAPDRYLRTASLVVAKPTSLTPEQRIVNHMHDSTIEIELYPIHQTTHYHSSLLRQSTIHTSNELNCKNHCSLLEAMEDVLFTDITILPS